MLRGGDRELGAGLYGRRGGWIRGSFLSHAAPVEKIIVHGHTIATDVEFGPHRIGIDTGAYASNRLTALGLEADQRWILQT